MRAIRVTVRGVVQGVGFRYFALRRANALGLVGTVRNLPDGSAVEVIAQGGEPEIEALLAEMAQGPRGSQVQSPEASVAGVLPVCRSESYNTDCGQEIKAAGGRQRMALIRVETSREIAAPPDRIYERLSEYGPGRAAWLPAANYSEMAVEKGGSGPGTEVRYRLKVGPRQRVYKMQISAPEPGVSVVETDSTSSMVFTWSVRPAGSRSRVMVTCQWSGGSGIRGFFERRFAPGGVRSVLDRALAGLDSAVTGTTGPAS